MTPEQAWQTAAARNESYFQGLQLSRLVASGNNLATQRDEWIAEAERRRLVAYKQYIAHRETKALLVDLAARVGISKDEINMILENRFKIALKDVPYESYYPKVTGGILDKIPAVPTVRG